MKVSKVIICIVLPYILSLVPSKVFAGTFENIGTKIYSLIIPLGIVMYLFLIITVISGIGRWKLKYHLILAIFTIIFATIHAAIVILSY